MTGSVGEECVGGDKSRRRVSFFGFFSFNYRSWLPCVLLQFFQWEVIQKAGVGRFEYQWPDHSCLICFGPSTRTNTPLVTGVQAWKAKLGSGSAEIVTLLFGKLQKLGCQVNAGRVFSCILFVGFATTISEKPRQWFA